MSGRPIVIQFASNVRDFLRGTKDVERGLDDIVTEMRDSTNDFDRFEDKFTDAMREAERAADRASDRIGDDMGRVRTEMGDVGREAGEEFRQNLGESLASGDLENLLSDTLGGLVASLKGPMGAAAGVVAAGVAIVISQVKGQYEEMMQSLYGLNESILATMLEQGRQFLFQQEQAALLKEAIKENPKFWSEMASAAKEAGVSTEDMQEALLSGGDALEAMKTRLREIIGQGTTVETQGRATSLHYNDSAKGAQDILRLLEKQGDELPGVVEQSRILSEWLGQSASNAGLMAAKLKESRDYAAGMGGSRPLVSTGPWQGI